jgi:hypothetical protein
MSPRRRTQPLLRFQESLPNHLQTEQGKSLNQQSLNTTSVNLTGYFSLTMIQHLCIIVTGPTHIARYIRSHKGRGQIHDRSNTAEQTKLCGIIIIKITEFRQYHSHVWTQLVHNQYHSHSEHNLLTTSIIPMSEYSLFTTRIIPMSNTTC